MAEVITMPRLSDTMQEGVIAAWHVKEGDTVSSGDLLAEIESDKATMDFESPEDGVVLHLGVAEGDGIPVGALLTILGEKGEDVSGIISGFVNTQEGAAEEAPAEEAASPAPEPAPVVEAAPAPVAVAAPAPEPVAAPVSGDRLKASPLAKAMAKARGIDLNTVNGTGDHGRIIKRDIENYQVPVAVPATKPAESAPETPAYVPPPVAGQEGFEETRISQMRKTIARRLSESKFTAPHFYLTMEIRMDKAVEARKQLNALSPVKISYNDMVIKAVAAALRQHPKVNSSWGDNVIRTNQHIHVGMAVAVDEGLLVPVIRFADAKGLTAIAAESKALAKKARDRTLQPSEWEGNTFTVSNLGMYGIEEFTAIINPPDACILAIGGIKQTPVVDDGEIKIGHVMKVTMSCDHRVVDGATGSAFLVTLREMLQDPLRMLL